MAYHLQVKIKLNKLTYLLISFFMIPLILSMYVLKMSNFNLLNGLLIHF